MSPKRKNKQKRQGRGPGHTPLAKHKRKGSTVLSPMAETNIEPIDWPRDLLPEHLWIAALADVFSFEHVHQPFRQFMDSIDSFVPDGSEAFGLISDFALVPVEKRHDFLSQYPQQIEELFHKPIGRILAFYPENPAHWLVSRKLIERDGPLDPVVELNRLRDLVTKLLPGKNDYAGHLRALPFGRILEHGSIEHPSDPAIIELMLKYPIECTQEEKYRVQQHARVLVNIFCMMKDQYKDKSWPQYFWRHNFDLAICEPHFYYVRGSKPVTRDLLPLLLEVLASNAETARKYVTDLWRNVKCDLYDPSQDEILFGLFSRIIRLYCLIVEDPRLWSRDIAGIMLRCLAESAITFAYLVTCGDAADYRSFQQYGEGQEKLLMLHLQDYYAKQTTLEGRDSASISDELGGFDVEMMNIELGHWTKRDTRKLAADAGMEHLHRMVFSPTSSDVHGTWVSLKQSSLSRCSEPLHRFHRLPSITEPPAYIDLIAVAQSVCQHCIDLAVEKLEYPDLDPSFKDIPLTMDADADQIEQMESESPDVA